MGIEAPRYVNSEAIFELSKDRNSADQNVEVEAAPVMELNECCSSSLESSSTSSIGRNSDDMSSHSSSEGEDSGQNEAQSAYNCPLDRMDALEEVLPIRRGISKFYNGKSKSFATLAEASSSSIKDIVKAENAYTRKRRNSLAYHHVWNKNRSSGGIAKKIISSSRSTLPLAVTGNRPDNSSNISEGSNSSSTSSSPPLRPPLHPQIVVLNSPDSTLSKQNFSPWRSVSLFDLSCNVCFVLFKCRPCDSVVYEILVYEL